MKTLVIRRFLPKVASILIEYNQLYQSFDMLQKIVNAGYRETLPDFLKNHVQPTNILALCLMFIVALPFTIISWYYAPFLAALPGLGIVTGCGVILANYAGMILVSRFFIAALPIWQVILYNAYLTEPGNPPISSLYLIAISFILVPFVIIDAREKWFLGVTAVFCGLAILLFPLLTEVFMLTEEQLVSVQEYTTMFDTGWLSTVTSMVAILAAFSSMWGIIFINSQAERRIMISRQQTETFNSQLLQEKKENEQKAQALQEAQENERRQQWINVGVNRIAETIRAHSSAMEDDTDLSVFDVILMNMIKYLEAVQGGFYVIDTDQSTDDTLAESVRIRLAACYAYERKKYVSQTLSPGEGLLGQAYLEKLPTYLTEIPENYVRITSGLGKACPQCLFVVPFMVNGQVEGLVEIASFTPLEEYQQTYVEQAGEVIAAFIQSDRNVRSMEQVLRRAQEQAETLSAQEEEIRQNMEEMQATQEHHERVMSEMKQEREALLAQIAEKDHLLH